MARTKAPAHKAPAPAHLHSHQATANPPKVTVSRKNNAKAAPKSKGSVNVDDARTAETGQPTHEATARTNTLKRPHEDGTAEPDQLATTTKKAKKAPGDGNIGKEDCNLLPAVRRSTRPQTKVPTTEGKRKRRTKEEIEADKAKAAAEKKRKEELIKENHRIMDQMDIDEDKDRAEVASRTIRTFADLERDSESGEEFTGFNSVLSDDDSDTSDSDVPMDATKLEEAHKALQKKMKELEAQMGGGKKNGTGGKKTAKKVTFASGLRSDWDDTVKKTSAKQAHVQISAGGLNDSDAEAVNPFPVPTLHPVAGPKKKAAQKLERDPSRKNEMIAIVEMDEKENAAPQPRAKKAAVKKVNTKALKTAQVKTETSSEVALPKEADKEEKAKQTKRINGNNVRLSDLPEFVGAKWREAFLPTLYDNFFASAEPFNNFSVGSTGFVAVLQSVVEEVYPEVEYTVTSSDSIHFLSYNRINKKCSNIGSYAIKLLQAHINTLKEDKAAKEWLRWCLQPGGPLFFRDPTPIGSAVNPKGRLLSRYVIDLAKHLLSLRAGSASENGPPQGLVALIVTTLERAARHLFNPTKQLKEFSKTSWGSQVEAYYKSFQADEKQEGISAERWQELMNLCSTSESNEVEESDMLEADLSILDDQRALLFNFPSPTKHRT